MNTFVIEYGDVTGDGHKEIRSFVIETKGTRDEIRESLGEIEKKTGFEFDTLCKDCEDKFISTKHIEILKKYGIEIGKDWEEEGIDSEIFENLIIKFLNIVNPELEVKISEKNIIISTDNWGYGLF